MCWRGSCLSVLVACLAACGDQPVSDGRDETFGGLTRVGDVLGGADEGFSRAVKPRAFVFPRDHGAHPRFKSEWWYLTSTLKTSAGEDLGVQFTIFRQALRPTPAGEGLWQSGQVYMAHIAVSDVAKATHLHDQRLARAHPAGAGVELEPQFRVFVEDWQLSGTFGEAARFSVVAKSAEGFSIELDLIQKQPILRQGEEGLSRKGPDQASYYYSYPALAVEGKIEIGKTMHEVVGKGWLDREWSTSVLGEGLLGWDWFALHLEDERELTFFQLRRKDCRVDSFNHGTMLSAQGERVDYQAAELKISPARTWRDGTGTEWPIDWSVDLGGERFEIVALFPDQVMSTGITYWEGIVAVRQAGERIGTGYLEMTGYSGEARCAG